jgi:ABC-type nitrate/sulfonate/bicarbonate transport system substrate-binding protein
MSAELQNEWRYPMRRITNATLLATALALAALPGLTEVPTLKDQPAPTFDLPTLAGDRFALADQRGKTVVLHFGTGW